MEIEIKDIPKGIFAAFSLYNFNDQITIISSSGSTEMATNHSSIERNIQLFSECYQISRHLSDNTQLSTQILKV